MKDNQESQKLIKIDSYLMELRSDLKEWRSLILTELKDRYKENSLLKDKVSDMEIKMIHLENELGGVQSEIEDILRSRAAAKENEKISKNGRYVIIAAIIAAFGSIAVDLMSIIKQLFSS